MSINFSCICAVHIHFSLLELNDSQVSCPMLTALRQRIQMLHQERAGQHSLCNGDSILSETSQVWQQQYGFRSCFQIILTLLMQCFPWSKWAVSVIWIIMNQKLHSMFQQINQSGILGHQVKLTLSGHYIGKKKKIHFKMVLYCFKWPGDKCYNI